MDAELPAFVGFLGTTLDAFIAVEAVRQQLAPRLKQRLSDKARKQIASGHIYVFTVQESGINRWTDGRKWQPSRILDNFLIYREKGAGATGSAPDSLESSLDASFSGFRDTGMIKKTITLCDYHVVAYYTPADVANKVLHTPSSTAQYASIRISSDLLTSSNLRYMPVVGYDDEGAFYESESPEITGTCLRLHTNRPRARENQLRKRSGSKSPGSTSQDLSHSASPPPLSTTSSYFTSISSSSASEFFPGGIILPDPLPVYANASPDLAQNSTSMSPGAISFPPRSLPPSKLVKMTERYRHAPYSYPSTSSSGFQQQQANLTDHSPAGFRTRETLDTVAARGRTTLNRLEAGNPRRRDSSSLPPVSPRSPYAEQHQASHPSQFQIRPFLPPLRPCSFPHLAHYAIHASAPEPYASIPPLSQSRKIDYQPRGWDREISESVPEIIFDQHSETALSSQLEQSRTGDGFWSKVLG